MVRILEGYILKDYTNGITSTRELHANGILVMKIMRY
jgi:hypothetical protein